MIQNVSAEGLLSEQEVRDTVQQAVKQWDLDGKKVLLLVPDHTRTAPVPLMFHAIFDGFSPKKLDCMVALGTHRPLEEEELCILFGISTAERRSRFGNVELMNHTWDKPETLKHIGTIPASEIRVLSEGLMEEDVEVTVNRKIFDYDHIILAAPTFPHEVVGFSGGNKYFFPGIAGPGILNFFHWLGAVITNVRTNGVKDTPVKRVIDRAASLIRVPVTCFSMVVTRDGLRGIFAGETAEAWSAAADLSARTHIVYRKAPFTRALGVAAKMYDDLWTAGKAMYKLEPVMADGGELIIYAPHIDQVSHTHGRTLDTIGYHVRDYFLKQMDRFAHIPRSVLAHSTHVKGQGTYENGIETPRINVVLATGIPEARCQRINLGYRDPSTIDIAEYEGRESEGILFVENAGEVLYRLA